MNSFVWFGYYFLNYVRLSNYKTRQYTFSYASQYARFRLRRQNPSVWKPKLLLSFEAQLENWNIFSSRCNQEILGHWCNDNACHTGWVVGQNMTSPSSSPLYAMFVGQDDNDNCRLVGQFLGQVVEVSHKCNWEHTTDKYDWWLVDKDGGLGLGCCKNNGSDNCMASLKSRTSSKGTGMNCSNYFVGSNTTTEQGSTNPKCIVCLSDSRRRMEKKLDTSTTSWRRRCRCCPVLRCPGTVVSKMSRVKGWMSSMTFC